MNSSHFRKYSLSEKTKNQNNKNQNLLSEMSSKFLGKIPKKKKNVNFKKKKNEIISLRINSIQNEINFIKSEEFQDKVKIKRN